MEKHIALALLDTLSTSEKLHLARLCHDGEDVFRFMGLKGTPYADLSQMKDSCMNWLEKPAHHITWLGDEGYPPLLKEMDDPPYLIAFQGSALCFDSTITIVVSGIPSRKARKEIHSLVRECVDSECTVVSGLCCNLRRSVLDSVVDCEGRALAVSGGDLVLDSPDGVPLVEKIVDLGGAVLGEFPVHHLGKPWHIPPWTRIPAGLSMVTVVGASSLRSEAMMVADFALDQGRDVVVLGGGEEGTGGKSLVQDGAPMIRSLQDIHVHSSIGCPKGGCRRASEHPWPYIPAL